MYAMNKNIKAIIFDVDGTLYSNLAMLFGAPLRYACSLRWFYHYSRMRGRLRRYLMTSQRHSKEFMESKSIEFFSKEIQKDEESAKRLLHEKIEKVWIAGLKKTSLRKGIRELIDDLHKKDFKLGVLSDFPAHEKLKNWGLFEKFDSIVSAEDHGRLKPDPYLFRLASKELGVRDDECVYVGNHVRYDGEGASQAGMENLIFADNPLLRMLRPRKNIRFIQSVKDIYSYLEI